MSGGSIEGNDRLGEKGTSKCKLCGGIMPPGEEMFNYHGYSGPCPVKSGIELIVAERQRQVEKEGYDQEHDQQHNDGCLIDAAVCYAKQAQGRRWLLEKDGYDDGAERYQLDEAPDYWPWDDEHWKPKDPVRDLVKAGALIAAEIDRLNREVDQ